MNQNPSADAAQLKALQDLAASIASHLNSGVPAEQIAAGLESDGVLPADAAVALVSRIAELRRRAYEQALRRAQRSALLKFVIREAGLFLGGATATLIACVIASLLLGVVDSFGRIGEGIAKIGEQVAGLGVSAAIAFLAQGMGSWGWLAGSVVGYLCYLYWLLQG